MKFGTVTLVSLLRTIQLQNIVHYHYCIHYVTDVTRWKVPIPAKAFLSPTLGNTCHTCYFAARQFRIFRRSYFVNNRRFTEFFDRYFHIPLAIVTKHELGLPFPPRNLRIKFGVNPSTIFLVINLSWSQTDRHTHTYTHKPTPVKTYSLAFVGIMTREFKSLILTSFILL